MNTTTNTPSTAKPEKRMPHTMSPKEFFEGPLRQALAAASPLRQLGGIIEFAIETDHKRQGGTWVVDLDKGDVKAGEAKKADVIVRAGALDFMALVEGRMSPSDGLLTQRLAISGEAVRIQRLLELLAALA